jgi:hypothetical protein
MPRYRIQRMTSSGLSASAGAWIDAEEIEAPNLAAAGEIATTHLGAASGPAAWEWPTPRVLVGRRGVKHVRVTELEE